MLVVKQNKALILWTHLSLILISPCFCVGIFVHNQLLNHSFTLHALLTCATKDDLTYTRIRYVLRPPG